MIKTQQLNNFVIDFIDLSLMILSKSCVLHTHIYIYINFQYIFRYAIVWGSSVKHQPQKVGRDHPLADEDVVQIVKK